jgi:hypothetical protein
MGIKYITFDFWRRQPALKFPLSSLSVAGKRTISILAGHHHSVASMRLDHNGSSYFVQFNRRRRRRTPPSPAKYVHRPVVIYLSFVCLFAASASPKRVFAFVCIQLTILSAVVIDRTLCITVLAVAAAMTNCE